MFKNVLNKLLYLHKVHMYKYICILCHCRILFLPVSNSDVRSLYSNLLWQRAKTCTAPHTRIPAALLLNNHSSRDLYNITP